MKNHCLRISWIGFLVLGLGLSSGSMAQDGAALYSQKGCAACHGPSGDQPIMPLYPKLAGQNADYLVRQMQDIKSGDRTNGQSAIMKPMMANVSESEMNAIAEYLSSQ